MTQREIIGKTPKISKLAIALAIAGLMIAGGFVALASSQPTATSPTANAAATSQSILPNPVMNSNITWSTFYSGWNPLEYSNGSANLTLNTGFSTTNANPISVNASAIQSTIFHQKIGSTWWNNSANWWTVGAGGGTILTVSDTTVNGQPAIQLQENSSAASGNQAVLALPITWGNLPSQNLAYDYVTITGYVYGTQVQQLDRPVIVNQTNFGSGIYFQTLQAVNESTKANYFAYSILPKESFFFSTNLNLPNISMTKSDGISIGMLSNMPGESSTPLYMVITGIALTTYPLTLGGTTLNSQNIASATVSNAQLTSLNPSFTWTDVLDNGYSVSTSQPLQNASITQTAINSGSYSEQVTYQGIEYLPSAPDLLYSGTNITLPMAISGKQYTLANLNGVSYLSAVQAKDNGTYLFGSVNPQAQNSIILQLDYTTSQWNSVSGAPPFFSLAGIEYYWWVGLIGFFSLIGLGSAALAHWGGVEENLRTPKGKFGR